MPWYKSVIPGSSGKRKSSKSSRDSLDETANASALDDGPVASTSAAVTEDALAPASLNTASASDTAAPRSRQSTSTSETDDVARDTALGASTSNGKQSNGIVGSEAASLGASTSASGAGHTAGNASVSSTKESVGAIDIPTTQTILSNPLPASQAASLGSNASGGLPASTQSVGGASLKAFDVDDMISRLLDHGYTAKITKSCALKNAEITAVCQAAREIFLSQPTLLELSPSVKIVGDVHGQYSDLIRLFEMCGFPPSANYLFLGDYVDRGKQSLETILLLLCYKIKYPENFFLLRGNHECANVTRVYGFYDECKRRTNIKVWKTFIDVFNCLPIAAVVASKIFCVHGGLSPSLQTMEDIRKIHRPSDVPDYGLLNDLLWSDPSDTALDWEDNERGVSYCFGKSVIQDFLARYDFDLICRAHMVVEDGYEFWNERTLVTIFSAPNYCGEFDNHGAVMTVSEDLLCSFELLKPLDNAALKKEMLEVAGEPLRQPPKRQQQRTAHCPTALLQLCHDTCNERSLSRLSMVVGRVTIL